MIVTKVKCKILLSPQLKEIAKDKNDNPRKKSTFFDKMENKTKIIRV